MQKGRKDEKQPETGKPRIRISVRNLVEFILRSGDLDSRKGGAPDAEAMLKGGRLHRKIQKQMGSGYEAEVSLKWESEYDDLIILVEGRADGILTKDGRVTVDEIKGIYGNVAKLEEPVMVHRAQAMCYARMYAEMKNLEEIGIQMTYANLDTEEIHRFEEILSLSELKDWYQQLLDQYYKWVSYQQKWRKLRNASMEGLEFPFPYREGQREMVKSVYHTISAGKQIFIQAPTGVGKTMSAVFPAVRAIGEGKAEVLFYLTAKTITRTVAEEAFSILGEKGLEFKTVTITAKEKLCFCEKAECNPEACPYAKGHFDRVNDAVYELWTTRHRYDRETIRSQAEKWQVCPFEMSLDLALWVDGVICDYNYVFDPNVRLKRFFGEGVSGKYLFLIDEAHNLVSRGREMYSAALVREEVLAVRKLSKNVSPKLYRALGKLAKQLLEMKNESKVPNQQSQEQKLSLEQQPQEQNLSLNQQSLLMQTADREKEKKDWEKYRILDNPGVIPITLMTVSGELEKLLDEPPADGIPEEILNFYFTVRDFLNVSDLVDENYVVYTENGEDGRFRLRLFCVNPAANLASCLEKGVSTVFFSATLLPMDYYRRLLSTRTDDYGIYVRSPFPQENRCILVGRDVSSRYTRRGYDEYRRMAEYIARLAWQKKGNYMAFFPSYKLMEEVYQIYQEEFSVDWVRCICQETSMGEQEREEFLTEFEKGNETLVAFCILGGIFSEGIDLMGEKLIGAAIVGTGLPQISNEGEILKEYYSKKGENGFDYAYRYPGMNKVLQAAGRVIRTREDVGVILLLDDRFGDYEYRPLFPAEWSDRRNCSLSSVDRLLGDFWKRELPDNEK